MRRSSKRAEIDPGALGQAARGDQLDLELLGQRLEARGNVNRVADRGERAGPAVAHVAEDHRPDVEADADAERLGQVMGQLLIELIERGRHRARRSQRVPARCRRIAVDAEQRHDAVADELVDPAALAFDRLAHGLEVLIEQEHHVVRQTSFGHAGEGAQVGEQHRNFPLHAQPGIDLDPHVVRPRARGQQRHHRELVGRPQLTGEAHVGARADPRQNARLVRCRRAASVRPRARPAPGRSSSGRGRRTPRHGAHRPRGSPRARSSPARSTRSRRPDSAAARAGRSAPALPGARARQGPPSRTTVKPSSTRSSAS